MKSILFLSALFLAPFSYAVELNNRFQETPNLQIYKKKHIKLDTVTMLCLSGTGYAMIEFIDPTQKASVDIYYKENEINDVSVNYKKDKQGLRIAFEHNEVLRQKQSQSAMIFHIKIPYLNRLEVSGNFYVQLLENQVLKNRSYRIESPLNKVVAIHTSGTSVVRCKALKTSLLSFVTRGDSRVVCERIEANEGVMIESHDTSKLYSNHLLLPHGGIMVKMFQSARIALLNVDALIITIQGRGSAKLLIKGAANTGRIFLTAGSDISGTKFHLKKCHLLDLGGSAEAYLTIDKIVKKSIGKNAKFYDEKSK